MSVQLHLGDCLSLLPTIPDASVDAIVTDPPYPCIDRDYGRMTEAEWHAMMRGVVAESRRILKPSGSAVFILQPNSEKVGRMRPWLWEFMAWTAREWNQVQDAWWWNHCTLPVGGTNKAGLMRPSLKACVWLGPSDCYRDQGSVLMVESEVNRNARLAERYATKTSVARSRSVTEGPRDDSRRMRTACVHRGGTTPFNVILAASNHANGARNGHPASTPTPVADWWTRYICPPGGTTCDPFMGSGTTGLSALKYGCSYVGIEKMPTYHAIASKRIDAAQAERSSMLPFAIHA